MTRTCMTLMSLVFLLTFAAQAPAQVVAGSPEDKAYQAIQAESNPDAKIKLVDDFEKQFPESKILKDALLIAMEQHRQKNDSARMVQTAEKVIKLDADNFTALLAASRTYALEKRNLNQAVQYSQRAVDVLEKFKAEPTPAGYQDEQWKEYVSSNLDLAKSMLAYAKSVRP